MARNLREERQLLNVEELALVGKSHAPVLKSLSDRDLVALLAMVRKRRDRSRDIAERQRREMRGKSKPKGARAAVDNTGTRGKRELLDAAVRRLNTEFARRKTKTTPKLSLSENARRALALRQAAKADVAHPSAGRTANPGKQAKTFAPVKAPRNLAKMGVVSQHTKNMQAKRDAKSRRAAR